MDDMKKLVERYKRELMEYSRATKTTPPAEQMFSEPASSLTPKEERSPEVIGYSDNDDFMSAFSDMFRELPEEKQNEPVAEDMPQEITELDNNDSDEISAAPDEADTAVSALTEDNGVSTVTPKKAEGLNDIPESGNAPDEQLAKRDFENQQPTVNPQEDIQPLKQDGTARPIPQEQEHSTLQEYTDANPRRGTVRFRTYTARGALPVKGAKIIVSKPIGGRTHVFYTLVTDESGQTPIISLPAPPKELSESPDSTITPYAMYNALITADGYNDVQIQNMPVFEGILSVQRVALVPSYGMNVPEVIPETEPDLNGGN